ncbi:MAG: TIGR02680 family protein [Acidimicrobiales bacterium]
MSIAHLGAARRAPSPSPGRLRPLRAGILNIWEYDDQELWFADGRLILRGQNTAGKSKALELLLPFVLDGDIRSERLDPFGSRSKTMYWNLVEFSEERSSAIGYSWVEFGQLDSEGDEHYVTCIVGMRAVRSAGKRVDPWWAVTQARVGVDLDLAPRGIPLTAERFKAALPEGSVVSPSAREHRAAVDRALFGLGPDRYEALLHLLLRLRRPKLSEKLDMGRLGEYLSDALPPLERHRMDSLASAFARLDEDTAEIERLEASAAALGAFLSHYRDHARLQTRLRADAVRSANTRLDKVTETERLQGAERDSAGAALEAIEARRVELSVGIDAMTGQLSGLDMSKVHALHEVERRATDAERHTAARSERAEMDLERSVAALAESEVAESDAASAEERRDKVATAIVALAEAAGLGAEHDMHKGRLLAEPDRSVLAMEGSVERRHQALLAVRTAAAAAGSALERIRSEEASHRRAESALGDAEDAESQARSRLEAAGSSLAEAVEFWAAEWQVSLAGGHAEQVVDEVMAGGQPRAARLLAPARGSLREEQVAAGAERRRLEGRRAEAADERRRVDAEADDAPPARPGRPAARAAGCAPLWACVDFAPELDAVERAGLEAALEAAGLLDALVSPSGAVLDPDTLDTWVAAGRTGSAGTGSAGAGSAGAGSAGDGSVAGGLAGLVPVTAGPLDEATVLAALAAVAGAGANCTSGGKWSVGPLHGAWSKPSAEYVGASARAQARARRVAALLAEIAVLDSDLANLGARDQSLAAELGRLDRAESAWPSADGLRDAVGDLRRTTEGAGVARAALAEAAERLHQARSEGRGAIDALARAEAAAGWAAAGLDEAFDALSRYGSALATLAGDARHALATRSAAVGANARARDAEAMAAAAATQLAEALATSTQARGEADELRRTSGADADAVVTRHRELSAAREAAEAERSALGLARDSAIDRLATARALLSATSDERVEHEAERKRALDALARLGATELAVLALGPIDGELDLAQKTAGLGFARSAYERLREVGVDQAAQDSVSNRFHNQMTTLRAQLGTDFDPYLDTSGGIEVCYATLNGDVVGATALAAALGSQIRRRREALSAEERQLIERHLLTEVGTHLGEQVHAAWSLTKRMNEQLAAHPTRSGVSLRLSWEVASDAGPSAEHAVRLLRQDVRLLDQPDRAALAAFLAERVRAAREDREGADVVERLSAALDYRLWHRFCIFRRSNGRDERLTSRTQGVGSGGEQAKLAHLPLFAATAAYYSSARPDAPHLLMLDEAFAGIDDSQRGDCMAMLVDLDLDMVLTNYSEWGCYPEVPAVAVYHLERTPGRPGVTALRFVWDGQARREDDPWLEAGADATTIRADGDGLFA